MAGVATTGEGVTLPLQALTPIESVGEADNKDKDRLSRLHYVGKFAQTILIRPITTTATLLYRTIKLLTWDAAKAGLYKVSGYHKEAAEFFERQYLKTVKVVRDLLFTPSVAVRAFKDMVATPETFDHCGTPMAAEKYLKVNHTTSFQQYSSYLHGIRTFRVISPEGIAEFAATSDRTLQTVMASHFLEPDMMAIDFGSPNVATFVTEKQADGTVQTVKVDAKSLRREEMTYHPTNGRMQSGVFLVPTNLPNEALARFKAAAQKLEMQQRKDITCVNTNCRVLKEAGFSIEGVAMDEVIFPTTLVEHLLFRNVFYTDSEGKKHKVHFDVINTTKQSLEEFFENVDTAVVGTRLRHNRRHGDTQADQEARGEAAKAIIAKEKERLAEAGAERVDDENVRQRRKVTISVPSFLGDAISHVWGRHTMYEVDLSDKKDDISAAFNSLGEETDKLRPFPQEKPSFLTRLKRDFFFSGPMIRFLRRHMMGRADEQFLHTQDLFKHLMSTKGAHLNYVLLDDKIVLARVQANGDREERVRKAADWALSKHALLSGREEVYCSGEIWYDADKGCFMMNRDSGTYAPSSERLGVIVKLANNIFNTQSSRMVFAEAVEAK